MNPNRILTGVAALLVCQSAGEALSRLLHLPLPGPVVGMVLLLIALRWEFVREPVGAAAEVLLPHLSLLFVPVGLGVITHLGLLRQFGWQLMVVLIVSAWTGLIVTAVVLRALPGRAALPVEGQE